MSNSEELIDHFCQSGGVFKNAALGFRDESGFYCYSLNSEEDSIISCPADLLIDCNDIGANKDGLYISTPHKYGKNIDFFNKYLSFHYNKNTLDKYIKIKHQIESLTNQEITYISRLFTHNYHMPDGVDDLEYAKNQLLLSHRTRDSSGRLILMPFVTFINHDKNGSKYEVNEDSISVRGRFKGEIFASYNNWDPVMIASTYGFITDSKLTYSRPMTIEIPDRPVVIINCKPEEMTTSHDGNPWPTVKKNSEAITISWFPIYYENHPFYPARTASLLAPEIGLTAEIFLYYILKSNLNLLLSTRFQLEKSENTYSQLVASAVKKQLQTICI